MKSKPKGRYDAKGRCDPQGIFDENGREIGGITKVACPRCGCFVVMDDVVYSMPEILPEPSDGCDKKLCSCHTGVGLMPRYEVTREKYVSAAQYMMENYSRCDMAGE